MYLGHFYWFVVWYYSHWWHLLPASDSANWIHTVKILVFRTCKIQSTVYATNSAFQLHGMSKFSHFHQPISSFWPVGHYKLHDSSIYGGRGHHKGIEQQKKKKKKKKTSQCPHLCGLFLLPMKVLYICPPAFISMLGTGDMNSSEMSLVFWNRIWTQFSYWF